LFGDLKLDNPGELFGKLSDGLSIGRCLGGGDGGEIDDKTLTEARYDVRVFVVYASFSKR